MKYNEFSKLMNINKSHKNPYSKQVNKEINSAQDIINQVTRSKYKQRGVI